MICQAGVLSGKCGLYNLANVGTIWQMEYNLSNVGMICQNNLADVGIICQMGVQSGKCGYNPSFEGIICQMRV